MSYFKLSYDGSPEGFLCALAFVLERGEAPDELVADGEGKVQAYLAFEGSESSIRVETDPARAASALDALSRLDPSLPEEFRILRESEPSMDAQTLRYLLEVSLRGSEARFDYADPNTRAVRKAHRKVTREIHRMMGLLRFEEAPGGILAARMEPDNDILPELAIHFMERLKTESFLILDLRRGKAFLKRGAAAEFLEAEEVLQKIGADLERLDSGAAALWRTYYAAIEVEGRKNPKLRRQFIPTRYWKYLPELEGAEGGQKDE